MAADPLSVQEKLGAAGCAATVEHAGRVWRVGHPTQAAKSRLEEAFAQHARREILRMGGTAAEWLEQVEQGAYATRQPGWVRIVRSPAWPALLLLSLLREQHPDATQADAESLVRAEPEQVAAACQRVAKDFFLVVLADSGLPAADREALAAWAVESFTTTTGPSTPASPASPGS